jgi:hypothetical protein
MQYNYELIKKNPSIFYISFYEEYPSNIFLRDLIVAIKEINPNILESDIKLNNYDIKTIDQYLSEIDIIEEEELCTPYYEFSANINTTVGDFELRMMDSKINLISDNNQKCIKTIETLLLKDINFNKVN